MKKTNQTKKERNNGITLIALVITIIVLLILAAVSIATLTGENGILSQATKAGEKNNEAEVEEQVKLEVMASYEDNGNFSMDKLKDNLKNHLGITDVTDTGDEENRKLEFELDGYKVEVDSKGTVTLKGEEETPPTGNKPGKPDENEIFTESSTIDGQKTSSKNNPIIPQGFKPIDEGQAVWGDGNQAPAQNSVDNGLVIEDIDYNQFVWVPVDSSKFQIIEGYRNKSKQSYITTCTEPFASGYSTEEAEYNAMKSSVETNGGFYIGRFEAGKDENGNVVVQKDVDVYNNIGWNASETNDMADETGGAVQKSKEFKNGKAYENSVTSTLIYGIQWDATMQFFDNNYINGITDTANSYVSNSTGKGNYDEDENTNSWRGQVAKTGSSPEYSIKNIYDMAGNVREWTMEANNTDNRVGRGGHYDSNGSNGSNFPASSRDRSYPSYSVDYIGFRIALYVE